MSTTALVVSVTFLMLADYCPHSR